MSLQWYVIRSKPQKEYTTRNRLLRLGFEVFLPVARTAMSNGERKERPLFPGYLFLRCNLGELKWAPLGQFSDFLGFVQFESVSPPVPDSLIGDLRGRVHRLEQQGGLWHAPQLGDRVRVKIGKLENLGEVLNTPQTPDERVWVLLQFLGSLVRAQVRQQDIIPDSKVSTTPLGPFVTRPPRRTRGGGRWIQTPSALEKHTPGFAVS